MKHDKELIGAANKYELVEMKIVVENTLVKERILTEENVCDYILFADGQSCALLKEYAISFFIVHHQEVLKSKYLDQLKQSGELMSEIMLLMGSESDKTNVNELRKELKKRELDIDGSRDVLVSGLNEAKLQRRI